MTYTLINPATRRKLGQSADLSELFNQLEHYTKQGKPVAIANAAGEMRAGNMLAAPYMGRKYK